MLISHMLNSMRLNWTSNFSYISTFFVILRPKVIVLLVCSFACLSAAGVGGCDRGLRGTGAGRHDGHARGRHAS